MYRSSRLTRDYTRIRRGRKKKLGPRISHNNNNTENYKSVIILYYASSLNARPVSVRHYEHDEQVHPT